MFTTSEVIPIAGVLIAIALFIVRPAIIGVSVSCAVLASAVGEAVLLASTRPAMKPEAFYLAAVIYLPIAILSVGGWAAVLAGIAALSVRAIRRRHGLSQTLLVAGCLVAGAAVGFAFSWLVTSVSGGPMPSDVELANRWKLAGTLGGAASGPVCALWRLGGKPPNSPLQPTSGGIPGVRRPM
jgi:hypothetical protein